jgi:hypothetical protein
MGTRYDVRRVSVKVNHLLSPPYHSVGGECVGDRVFDYFGSWSEAPGDRLVTYEAAFGQ